jgi:hypothetical protein
MLQPSPPSPSIQPPSIQAFGRNNYVRNQQRHIKCKIYASGTENYLLPAIEFCPFQLSILSTSLYEGSERKTQAESRLDMDWVSHQAHRIHPPPASISAWVEGGGGRILCSTFETNHSCSDLCWGRVLYCM